MSNSRARARIEARIRERAAYCVEFELNDPRSAFVTVTKVEVTSDLTTARIFYTVLGTDGERSKVAHMLEDATGFIRSQVGRVLRMRRIPRVLWIYDESIEIQATMEKRIAEALQRDRMINPGAHVGVSREDAASDEDVADDETAFDALDSDDAENA